MIGNGWVTQRSLPSPHEFQSGLLQDIQIYPDSNPDFHELDVHGVFDPPQKWTG